MPSGKRSNILDGDDGIGMRSMLEHKFLIFGFICFITGSMIGNWDASVIVIFPVFQGEGPRSMIGGLLIMAGFICMFLWFGRERRYPHRTKRGHRTRDDRSVGNDHRTSRTSGVVFIGPIPIVWGTERPPFWLLLLIGLLIFIIMIVAASYIYR